jgi:3-phenylpropionate/trans-cinnamate dioxygenase ferredoxin component
MLHFAVNYDELVKDFKKRVVIEGTPILVTILADKVYAIQDKCTHMGASLSKGTLNDHEVQCRLHGAVFDLNTGEVQTKPHISFIKMPAKKAKVFQTVIQDEKVYIDIK